MLFNSKLSEQCSLNMHTDAEMELAPLIKLLGLLPPLTLFTLLSLLATCLER